MNPWLYFGIGLLAMFLSYLFNFFLLLKIRKDPEFAKEWYYILIIVLLTILFLFGLIMNFVGFVKYENIKNKPV